MKIAIIGAGIVGMTSAYYLTKKNHSVTVYDREPSPAMKCSYANGGQFSVCNSETWNTWNNVKKGLKWMLKKDAPLLIRPMPTPSKIFWLAGFLRHVLNNTHERNTIRTIMLAKQSQQLYEQLIDSEQIEFDRRQSGIMHVYSDEKSIEEAYSSKSLFENNGIEWKFLTPEEIIQRDKGMRDFKNLKGGFLTMSDWTGDAHLFCQKLQSVCESLGTTFKFNTDVIGIGGKNIIYKQNDIDERIHESYDAVVLCNGHEMTKWSFAHGDYLNIYPVKGYSITIPEAASAPEISLLDDSKKIVCSLLGNRLRVAGTAELDGNNLDICQDRIKPLLNWVNENFPSINTTVYSRWACLRPMSSDMLPMIIKSKSDGLWYHGGHGHLGWTLAAATSYRLSNLI